MQSSLDRAFRLGQAALELDESHADSYALLSFCYSLQGDHEQALETAENAVELAPNHAFIVALSAAILRAEGRLQDAVWRIEKAMRLCPIYPAWYLQILGSSYHLLGDQNAALEALREGARREPQSILFKPWLLSVLVELKLKEEAGSVATDILRIEPEFSRKSWARIVGIKNPAMTAKLLENLEKGGLPE